MSLSYFSKLLFDIGNQEIQTLSVLAVCVGLCIFVVAGANSQSKRAIRSDQVNDSFFTF
jgi:hypothetical protein